MASSGRANGKGRRGIKHELHQMLVCAEWEQSISRRPVLHRIPASPTKASIQLLRFSAKEEIEQRQ